MPGIKVVFTFGDEGEVVYDLDPDTVRFSADSDAVYGEPTETGFVAVKGTTNHRIELAGKLK